MDVPSLETFQEWHGLELGSLYHKAETEPLESITPAERAILANAQMKRALEMGPSSQVEVPIAMQFAQTMTNYPGVPVTIGLDLGSQVIGVLPAYALPIRRNYEIEEFRITSQAAGVDFEKWASEVLGYVQGIDMILEKKVIQEFKYKGIYEAMGLDPETTSAASFLDAIKNQDIARRILGGDSAITPEQEEAFKSFAEIWLPTYLQGLDLQNWIQEKYYSNPENN